MAQGVRTRRSRGHSRRWASPTARPGGLLRHQRGAGAAEAPGPVPAAAHLGEALAGACESAARFGGGSETPADGGEGHVELWGTESGGRQAGLPGAQAGPSAEGGRRAGLPGADVPAMSGAEAAAGAAVGAAISASASRLCRRRRRRRRLLLRTWRPRA